MKRYLINLWCLDAALAVLWFLDLLGSHEPAGFRLLILGVVILGLFVQLAFLWRSYRKQYRYRRRLERALDHYHTREIKTASIKNNQTP